MSGLAISAMKIKAIKGLFGGRRKKAPAEEQELAMPDEEELRRLARKRQAALAQRGGRASTILDEDALG